MVRIDGVIVSDAAAEVLAVVAARAGLTMAQVLSRMVEASREAYLQMSPEIRAIADEQAEKVLSPVCDAQLPPEVATLFRN